jgi:hypothetical protein
MLEHAETSILEAETLSHCPVLKKEDKLTQNISKIIKMLNKLWPKNYLPQDAKRLAENINHLIQNIDIGVSELNEMIEKETREGRGANTLNLSPYGVIVQTLLNQNEKKIVNYLKDPNKNHKIYFYNEIEIPQNLEKSEFKNAIFLSH